MTTIEPLARPFAFFTVGAVVGSILAQSAGQAKAEKLFSSIALGMSITGLIGAAALTLTGTCLGAGAIIMHGQESQQLGKASGKKLGGAFALGAASVLTLTILGLRALAK